jgi:hypothetical protein
MSQALGIFSWNMQSPGEFGGSADLDFLSEHLKNFHGYDIYAFCEILDGTWADRFRLILQESEQATFTSILGTTGSGGDRILVLFRDSTLGQTSAHEELMDMKEGGGRAPLVVPLEIRALGVPFKFIMNHLHSSNTSKRLKQAESLNNWARQQTGALIAAGDYNFFDVRTKHSALIDEGFELITKDSILKWVQPNVLVPTQFDPKIDIDWILDFVFVGGIAQTWPASSEILMSDKPRNYFLLEEMTDHRPLTAWFQV